ncbi:MAG: CHAT domain-containing protein [Bacteroidetes bacterium]|nr:CHAT domain-containing protein [Bacteroidota bacterium]
MHARRVVLFFPIRDRIGYSATLIALLLVLSATDLSAQVDVRTSCFPVGARQFRSPSDSLACLRGFDRIDSLAEFLSAEMPRSLIDRYISVCDVQLRRVRTSLTDTLHPLYAEALAYAAEARWLVDHDGSTKIFERAIAILDGLTPPCRSAWAGRMFGNLAYQYYELERLDEAVALYGRSIDILTSLPDPPPTLTASQYLFLGLAERRALRYEEAAKAFGASGEWQLRAGDTSRAAEALSWYADARFRLHDFDGAERSYIRCCDLLRRSSGEQSEATLGAMQELATYYMFLARYNDARRILADVLRAVNRPGAEYDPVLVFFVHSMTAQVCADLGDDAEAEAGFTRAAEAVDRIPKGEQPMYRAMITNNTASFLANRERQAEAAALIEESLRLMDASSWKDVERFKARASSNLGSVYSELKRYDEADSLLSASVAMYEHMFGPTSTELTAPLSNLGLVYRDTKQYDRARVYVRRALGISMASYGASHPLSARLLRNLGSIELAAGNDSTAITMLRSAYDELLRWYDPSHVEVLDCSQLLGRWFERHPDAPDAADAMRALLDGTARRLRESFEFESEARQLRLHERVVGSNLGILARWASAPGSGRDAPSILLDAALQLQGAILSENVRFNRALRGRQQEAALLASLQNVRERYASLAGKNPDENLLMLRKQLAREIDSLDAALRKSSAGYGMQRRAQEAGWRDVQRLLQRGEALVDYLIVPPAEGDSSRIILALVLRNAGFPTVHRLCTERELETVLRLQLNDRMLSLLPDTFRMRRLAQMLWRPLAAALHESERVIVVPDGVLHRVSFPALLVDDGQGSARFLDELVKIQQYSCLQELLVRSPFYQLGTDEANAAFLLIGNPDFGSGSAPRGSSASRAQWNPLPGTKQELERIAEVCTARAIPLRMIEGKEASEDYVKGLSGGDIRVLHIATHGFFFPVPRSDESGFDQQPFSRGREYFRGDDHPLLRSGLILAGANKAWIGAPITGTKEDGILTALEISRLNLEGTELVVLSACETALGDIRTGDGVFGLQRSFLAAGASSLLMSLWKVPDRPTAELMAAFYSKWLSGMTKADALRQARADLRAKYPDPRIWAPFVLIGN